MGHVLKDVHIAVDGQDIGGWAEVRLPKLAASEPEWIGVDYGTSFDLEFQPDKTGLAMLRRWASAPRRRRGHPHRRPLPRLSI